MHFLGTTGFCQVQNKTELDPCHEKDIFVGYDKQSSTYLFIFWKQQLLKELGV